jgi:hypothetical protein
MTVAMLGVLDADCKNATGKYISKAITLSVVMLTVLYADCSYAECLL